MSHPRAQVHCMSELVEPIATRSFGRGTTAAFEGHGLRGYWDGYFAGRAAPLGSAPVEVVHAVLYNFAPGEIARHVPRVWEHVTPQQAVEIWQRTSAVALRERVGELADAPGLARVADLATRAAVSAPLEGRPLYAGLRATPVPDEPVARLWYAANLLREHRGDSHNAVLVSHGIGGSEAHVLFSLALDIEPHEFSRLHQLPREYVDAVVEGLRVRGLVDADGFTDEGRALRQRMEDLTDDLAGAAYDVLADEELDELVAGLEPIAAAI